MKFENNQVFKVMKNQKVKKGDYEYYTPGTILVYAKLRKRRNKYIVLPKRDISGNKIDATPMLFDNKETAEKFMKNVYGITEGSS